MSTYSLTYDQALAFIEQERLRDEVFRIQGLIDNGKVWQDSYDGALAASMIACGMCSERSSRMARRG